MINTQQKMEKARNAMDIAFVLTVNVRLDTRKLKVKRKLDQKCTSKSSRS